MDVGEAALTGVGVDHQRRDHNNLTGLIGDAPTVLKLESTMAGCTVDQLPGLMGVPADIEGFRMFSDK